MDTSCGASQTALSLRRSCDAPAAWPRAQGFPRPVPPSGPPPAGRRTVRRRSRSSATDSVAVVRRAIREAMAGFERQMGDPRCEIARAAEAITSPEAGQAWARVARNSALLGSCPRSLPQVRSGFECWVKLARDVLQRKGGVLPSSVDGLLLWSTTFRCRATFCNYLSHLKKACHVARVSDAALAHASLSGAKLAIEKRSGWSARPRLAIRMILLELLLERPGALPEDGGLGFLFVTAYAFLLRLPSEALVIQRAASLNDASQLRAGLFIDEEAAVLSLARRKNRERRTTIVRKCWCKRSRATCPVHALGAWLNSRPDGDAPWAGWCATSVRSALRAALRHVAVGDADAYGTHSFRRGHAQDIVEFGGRVTDILKAGDWQMPAWMRYLDIEKMERQAVAEAHFGASSSDDERGEAVPPGAQRQVRARLLLTRLRQAHRALAHFCLVRRSFSHGLRVCGRISAWQWVAAGLRAPQARWGSARPQPLGPWQWVWYPSTSACALARQPPASVDATGWRGSQRRTAAASPNVA